MYKNQLQELAQRSCFNLPSYACIREGPDHAPRFKASVNFHGEIFQGPSYCPTLRQAEHAAAEVALNNLSNRGTSRTLAARVLDETGVYKNLLQETAHRAGLKLPVYTTIRSGPGHQPIFTSSVELAGMSFYGEPAKTKKQAEKNAAMVAWSSLKAMPNLESLQSKEIVIGEEHEQVVVVRVLSNFKTKDENRPQHKRRMDSPQNALSFRHQLRFNDPLSDCSSIAEKQRGFLALGGPKILPPSLLLPQSAINRPIANLRDGWVNEISTARGKSTANDHFVNSKPMQELGPSPPYHREFPLPYQRRQQIDMPLSPQMRNPIVGSFPRTMGSGGLHGIAPAVLIRSVVPVCAAPSPPRPSRQKDAKEELLVAASKLRQLQL